MAQVTLLDYGSGNTLSVLRAFKQTGADVILAKDANGIKDAEYLVVPGVGAFGDCMDSLRHRNLMASLWDYAISGRPLLGICVGMQILFETSEEFGKHEGLKILQGHIKKIPTTNSDKISLKIPHVGWNCLSATDNSWSGSFLQETPEGTAVYFVHSFTAKPDNPADILATTNYNGYRIVAAVRRGNICGTQFHPEKSATAGLMMLRTFLNS